MDQLVGIADVHEALAGAVADAQAGHGNIVGDVHAGQGQLGVADGTGEGHAEEDALTCGIVVGEGQDDLAGIVAVDGRVDLLRLGPCGAGHGADVGQDCGVVGQDQLAVGNGLGFGGQDVDLDHATLSCAGNAQREGCAVFRGHCADAQDIDEHRNSHQENKPFFHVSHRFTSLEYLPGHEGNPAFLTAEITSL